MSQKAKGACSIHADDGSRYSGRQNEVDERYTSELVFSLAERQDTSCSRSRALCAARWPEATSRAKAGAAASNSARMRSSAAKSSLLSLLSAQRSKISKAPRSQAE